MSKISYAMLGMLRQVARGDYIDGGPLMVGNTNLTAEALESRKLIVKADDQSRARRTLKYAWILTEAGRQALDA